MARFSSFIHEMVTCRTFIYKMASGKLFYGVLAPSTFTFMFWPGLEVSCLQNGLSILGKLENGHCAEPSPRSGALIGCLWVFPGWRDGGGHALARPRHGNCHGDSITTVAAHGRSFCCDLFDDTSCTPFAAKSFKLQSESA